LFVARDRLAGYRIGLAEAGIAFDPALVVRTPFDRAGGALGVDTLLAGDARFSAIACANDLLALGVLERLAERGIDVPGEVSLAGFDDIAIAAMTAPALSTVRLPLRELGRLGYVHAGRVLEGIEAAHEILPTELVLRGSTGRPSAVVLPDARRTDRRAAS
jgi:LacI family transcriptional regulator